MAGTGTKFRLELGFPFLFGPVVPLQGLHRSTA